MPGILVAHVLGGCDLSCRHPDFELTGADLRQRHNEVARGLHQIIGTIREAVHEEACDDPDEEAGEQSDRGQDSEAVADA